MLLLSSFDDSIRRRTYHEITPPFSLDISEKAAGIIGHSRPFHCSRFAVTESSQHCCVSGRDQIAPDTLSRLEKRRSSRDSCLARGCSVHSTRNRSRPGRHPDANSQNIASEQMRRCTRYLRVMHYRLPLGAPKPAMVQVAPRVVFADQGCALA